jgi:hypothetical protein
MARSGRVGVVLLLAAAAVVGATAQEMCPTRAGFEGCRRRGCMSVQTTRRSSTVVCNSCAAGYALVNGGSRTAKCGECVSYTSTPPPTHTQDALRISHARSLIR